jgi:hypothetical protein
MAPRKPKPTQRRNPDDALQDEAIAACVKEFATWLTGAKSRTIGSLTKEEATKLCTAVVHAWIRKRAEQAQRPEVIARDLDSFIRVDLDDPLPDTFGPASFEDLLD